MSDTRVYRDMYKDVPSIVLESDSLRVCALPGFGSKIASMVYKPFSHELLWQTPGEKYRRTKYGDDYLEGEVSGFDEMFPSISRCFYGEFPWQGTEIPDHGEVWSVPWECSEKDGRLRFVCHGTRFPYRLSKELILEDKALMIEYQAENLSCFRFNFIWAAHPLFAADQGMEIIIPEGMESIINSVETKRLGDYGRSYSFPTAQLRDGTSVSLNTIQPRNGTDFYKYWFKDKMSEGWCLLYNNQKQLNIGLCFPKAQVPYLGVFVNEGGLLGQYEIAPEPATASMDRIDASELWGTKSTLEPRGSLRWSLKLLFEAGPRRSGIDAFGQFV